MTDILLLVLGLLLIVGWGAFIVVLRNRSVIKSMPALISLSGGKTKIMYTGQYY